MPLNTHNTKSHKLRKVNMLEIQVEFSDEKKEVTFVGDMKTKKHVSGNDAITDPLLYVDIPSTVEPNILI